MMFIDEPNSNIFYNMNMVHLSIKLIVIKRYNAKIGFLFGKPIFLLFRIAAEADGVKCY